MVLHVADRLRGTSGVPISPRNKGKKKGSFAIAEASPQRAAVSGFQGWFRYWVWIYTICRGISCVVRRWEIKRTDGQPSTREVPANTPRSTTEKCLSDGAWGGS